MSTCKFVVNAAYDTMACSTRGDSPSRPACPIMMDDISRRLTGAMFSCHYGLLRCSRMASLTRYT
jgi:hypothetical protein